MLATSLTQFLREWCVEECSQISHKYTGRVRDAFAEVLKDLMCQAGVGSKGLNEAEFMKDMCIRPRSAARA